MKPIYLKPDQSLLFVPMKDEPTIFPFGPIAELIAVGKRPFIVGEECYVREAWAKSIVEGLIYKDGYDVPDAPRWRSPVTMPQWASRRHVRIVSCEPIQQDGKWKWRVEVKEVKA